MELQIQSRSQIRADPNTLAPGSDPLCSGPYPVRGLCTGTPGHMVAWLICPDCAECSTFNCVWRSEKNSRERDRKSVAHPQAHPSLSTILSFNAKVWAFLKPEGPISNKFDHVTLKLYHSWQERIFLVCKRHIWCIQNQFRRSWFTWWGQNFWLIDIECF